MYTEWKQPDIEMLFVWNVYTAILKMDNQQRPTV